MNQVFKALALYAGAFSLLWALSARVKLPAPPGFESVGACSMQWYRGRSDSMLNARLEGLREAGSNASGQPIYEDGQGRLYEFALSCEKGGSVLAVRHTSNELISERSLAIPRIQRGLTQAQYISSAALDQPMRKTYLEGLFRGWQETACYETDRLTVFSFQKQNLQVQAALRMDPTGTTLLLGAPAVEGGY